MLFSLSGPLDSAYSLGYATQPQSIPAWLLSYVPQATLMQLYCFRQVKEKKVLVVDFSHVGFFGV